MLLRSEILDARRATVPLGPWIALCERTGVPYVPAEFGPLFPMREAYAALDAGPGSDPREIAPTLMAAFDWLRDRRNSPEATFSPHMARWECCSGDDVKYQMGTGSGYSADFVGLMLDDPRFFDCTVGEETRMVWRPWVAAWSIDNYPVEFRVYADGGGLIGVSSYYPQRPLPETYLVIRAAERATQLAGDLWSAGTWPVGCTADFLVSATGEVLFLEGGPPHAVDPFISAHPCCFAAGKIGEPTFRVLAPVPGSPCAT